MTSTHPLMPEITREFERFIPMAFDTYKSLGSGPVSTHVIKFYKNFDTLLSKTSIQISCKPGCNYCCHYHVEATATEIFAMAETISKMPAAERENIRNKIKLTADRVGKLSVDEYIHTNIECAMLKDGQCSVYSVRPLACRGHHSADVRVCREAYENVRSTALAPKDSGMEVTFRAFENLQLLVNHQKGLDTSKYELHAALNEAISNPASFKRWKDGKIAFPSVKDRHTLEEMMGEN